MGWFGHKIYDGDETQTRHLDYCKWAKLYKDKGKEGYDWQDTHLLIIGTILNKEEQNLLLKNIKLVLKKMPKSKFWNIDNALEWQMLGALFIDNKLKIPKIIKTNAILGTEYLMGEDASDFTNPSLRRKHLKNFITKIKKIRSYNL